MRLFLFAFSILLLVGIESSASAQERWIRLDSVTDQQLMKVQFFDASKGYVLGRQGGFFRTKDGGRNWDQKTITYPQPFLHVDLMEMHFHDAQIGVVAGSVDTSNGFVADPRATLFWTTDGGNTWEPQMFDEAGSILFLQFLDRKLAYFAASKSDGITPSMLYYTDAGGSTTALWKKITEFPAPQILYGMDFKDNATGILAGRGELVIPNNLYLTEDGGDHWSTFTGDQNGSSVSFGALHWNDDGLLATNGSRILFSLDNGHTWGVVASTAGSAFYNGFSFADNNIGFAVPMISGKILRTTNGGYAWETQELPEFAILQDLFAVTEQVAYAVGVGGKMFKLTAQSSVASERDTPRALSVFPSPARNFAYLEAIPSDHARTGHIFDRMGREVMAFDVSMTGDVRLDLRLLSNGAYSVVLNGHTSELIIER